MKIEKITFKRYILNVLIGIDQLGNALLKGNPDETISSRSYRRRVEGSKRWALAERVINVLFYRDRVTLPDGTVYKHCQLSMISELRSAMIADITYKRDVFEEVVKQLGK